MNTLQILTDAEQLGLNLKGLITLLTIQSGPVGLTDLAQILRVTTAGVTSILDRLEELGYASRERIGTDRRAWFATLTPEGEALLDRYQIMPCADEDLLTGNYGILPGLRTGPVSVYDQSLAS